MTINYKRMDKVKLGRALGYGARHAAKTMVQAVDAATSPDPRVRTTARRPAGEAVAHVANVAQTVHRAKSEAKKQAKSAVMAPVRKFTSVVWMQVTGCFFALFALTMAGAVVRHHNDFSLGMQTEAGRNVYFYVSALVVFAYFSISNFVRAKRRERQ